jgi:hypothetical protein
MVEFLWKFHSVHFGPILWMVRSIPVIHTGWNPLSRHGHLHSALWCGPFRNSLS